MIRQGCVLLVLLLLLSACAGKQADQVVVSTGSPVVHIHPVGGEYRHSSVLILPFRVPSEVDPIYGRRLAAMYHEVLLGKQAFQRILVSDKFYGSYEEAMEMGQEAGVDLVLAGRVNYLLSGTQLGGARADVSLRVVSVKSGNTVWYMSQMMDQLVDHPEWRLPGRLMSIFTVPKIRSSSGPSPLPNMLAHIAVSMGDVMAGQSKVTAMGKL